MAIRFTKASSQYLSAPDNAYATFPNGNWSLAFFLNVVSAPASATPEYVFSNANFGDTASVNIALNSISASHDNKVVVWCGADAGGSPRIVCTNTHTTGWKLYVLQRSGTTLTMRSCAILGSAPSDGSAVVAEASATLNTAMDGAGFVLGGRNDLSATRFLNQTLTRAFKVDQTLTDLQVAQLAYGMSPYDLQIVPSWYVRMSDNSDYLDNQGSLTVTKTNAPTTATEPSFGFSTTTGTMVQTTSIAHRIFQRSGTSASVVLSGTYTGTAPDTLKARLYDYAGTSVLLDWTALTSTSISGGNWSGTLSAPAGGLYRVAVEGYTGSTAIANTNVNSNTWGVGDLYVCFGSSSSSKWFDNSTTGPDASVLCRQYSTAGGWQAINPTCAAGYFGVNVAANSTYPVGLLNCGVGGTTAAGWASQDANWTAMTDAITAVGGSIKAALIAVGSNDAAAGTIASKAAQIANWRTIISNLRTFVSNSSLPIFISQTQRRNTASLNDTQFDYARQAEMDLANNDARVYMGAQTVDQPLYIDNIHLTEAGYITVMRYRMAQSVNYVLGTGVTYQRGPQIQSYSGSGTTITVNLTQRGGTTFTPTTGITGFTASDGSGALTISSAVRTSGTVITLTVNRTITGTLVVKYWSGYNPDISAPVVDNTALTLPLEFMVDLPPVLGLGTAVRVGSLLVSQTGKVYVVSGKTIIAGGVPAFFIQGNDIISRQGSYAGRIH